ncbi:MAG TPA: pyruvate ferredoxin oxidoreductase [Candidatus Limnocylindria bacterium]|jgi:pyruvate ferredoxin oxidoreductase alpha subunit|nr:pyruvate ferredoxin oxidoreductase [Candidatus Limnocylindria bacterium]
MAVEVKTRETSEVETEQLATGCEAIAEAIRLADVDVMAAYPIRPYDGVMQAAAKLIANGKMDVEYIVADGEHSQFEIVKHACAVGSRVFVGSSGVGWFYAFEAIAVTAGLRLPVVAICGNRALDDPGAFGTEHNDSLAVRDLGWLLPWAETAQEALDLALMAWRVGEDKRVSLPVAIGLDGAFLTHSQHIVKIPTQAAVNAFLPKFDLGDRLLHPDNPITIAPQVDQDWLMEIRRQNDAAMRSALGVIREAHADFKRIFGRGGDSPFLDEYMTEDAEFVVIGQGTLSLPMKVAIRRLRKERGLRIGLVRLKWFRPFPTEEVVKSLRRFKAVGVIDRDYSFGSPYYGGVLYNEIRSALYSQDKRPVIVGFIAGLGGREIEQPMATEIFEKTMAAANGGLASGDVCHWIGVRE